MCPGICTWIIPLLNPSSSIIKECEKLAGEDGKLFLTWLLQVQDKAVMFTWIPILTIKGKLLTQQFAELSMEEVRAHAQVYQNRLSRLKASISRAVYNKVYLQMSKYIVYRDKTHEPFKHQILNQTNQETNGTNQPLYEECTKGDVSKLCEHTRELTYELNAAGETTNDLLENLIEALKGGTRHQFSEMGWEIRWTYGQ
jgi:hypothetical protein